ncbi:MAG: hypothetical protein IJH64_04225, partial [Oscillospiraceae bacterium]|nr:hypothetical protein [Clostridia bacterium]MBR0341437.1 hypothetical protein [Oscillospiraceae bacterium]
ALDSDHAMALPHIFGEANNTWYAVSDENTGCTLSDFDRRELSLNRAAQIMYSLCSAIGALHERGYLYLDIKPDNINVYSLDGREHVRLFDFDTVQKKSDLRKAKYSTYSDGWAPSEQKNWLAKSISERTDIYSLGAVFFWLLTGRKPVGDTYTDENTENDVERIKECRFDWRQFPLCEDASDGVIELLQRIFRKTLNTASTRYESVAKMQLDLKDLISRTGGNPAVEKILLQAKTEAFAFRSNIKEDLLELKRAILKRDDLVTKNEESESKAKDRYEGETQKGIPNGNGIYYLSNGDRYEGFFKEGEPFGRCSYFFGSEHESCIEKVCGDFHGFCFPSSGMVMYSNGDVYQGDLMDGIPHGDGVLQHKSGDVFRGQYRKGKREGFGVTDRQNGDIYVGIFKDDCLNKGAYYYHGMSCLYEGSFENGLKSGKGTLYYSDGSKDEGVFLEDQLNGFVKRTNSDGSISESYYISGEKADPKTIESKEIDDPAFRMLKIMSALKTIKERDYSFTTRNLIFSVCSQLKKMIQTEAGKEYLLQYREMIRAQLLECSNRYSREAIRSGDLSLHEAKETISSIIEKLDKCKLRTLGWGPERHVFDKSEFVSYPAINSAKDNPKYGDERAFIYTKKHGEAKYCSSILDVEPGEKYDVLIYYNNDADSSLDSNYACARNVRVSAGFPKVLKKGETYEISSVISSTNTSPQAVWCQRYLRTTYEKLFLYYVHGSAIIHNNGALDGTHLTDSLFSGEGTYVGVNALDGNILAGKDSSGYIEYTIEAVELAGTIKQDVSYDGVNYQDTIYAATNADVYFRLIITNCGNSAITNAVVRILVSHGLSPIPGSATYSANHSHVREHLSDSVFKTGVNFGRIGTGNTLYLFFKCTISDEMHSGDCMISSAYLVYDSEAKEGDKQFTTTCIRVGNGSQTPWGPARKTFTNNAPAPYVTFNSITDNAGVGDERNFVRIREANANSTYVDEVKVIPGKIYEVYIYYMNDASPSLANTVKGIARDVRIVSSFPKVVTAAKKYTVNATISSSNAIPISVWDGAYITADEDVVLEYVPNSMRLHSFTETHGQALDPSEVFSEKGALISLYRDQPGIITSKTGEDSGYITYCLVAKKKAE